MLTIEQIIRIQVLVELHKQSQEKAGIDTTRWVEILSALDDELRQKGFEPKPRAPSTMKELEGLWE